MDRSIDDGCIKTQRSMRDYLKKAAFISVIFAMVMVTVVGTASAALPTLLFLQGKVTDTSGVPVSSGDIKVEIYTTSTGGSAIFTETHTSAISEGFFDVLVGSVTTLKLNFNDEYYMEVYVGATEVIGDGVNNRINFTASGGEIEGADIASATITAAKLFDDYVDVTGDTMTGALILPPNGLTVGTDQLVVSGGSVGIGTTSPSQKLDVIGYVRGFTGLCISGDCRTSWPSVGSGATNYVSKWTSSSTLGNSQIYDSGTNVGIGTTSPGAKLDVEVSSGGAATIGSSLNSATGDYAVAMGYGTNASGPYSTALGYWTTANGPYSTAMGSSTTASGSSSTAMGRQTTASGWFSTAMGREIEDRETIQLPLP